MYLAAMNVSLAIVSMETEKNSVLQQGLNPWPRDALTSWTMEPQRDGTFLGTNNAWSWINGRNDIYEMTHTLNCRHDIKWSYDPRSYRWPRSIYRPLYRPLYQSTVDRLSADSRVDRYNVPPSILDRYVTDTWPILDRYTTVTWPTHDRYLTDSWSTHDRYFTDTWPTPDRYFSDTSPKLHWYFTCIYHMYLSWVT